MEFRQRILLFLIVSTAKRSHSYKMDPITKSSIINETSTPSTKAVLLEFESRRSPTLKVLPSQLALEDVVDLCEALSKDDSSVIEGNEKKLFYYIPVKPKGGESFPIFTVPCYGWRKKKCIGTPKPPFDYRCAYWTPFARDVGNCNDDSNSNEDGGGTVFRRRRMTKRFNPVTLSGFEAVTICATVKNLVEPGKYKIELQSTALPTNEASELRCVNWLLSPEGGWYKEKLEKRACDLSNAKRPSPYADSEINTKEGIVEDMFADVVGCSSIGQRVDCVFHRRFGVV